MDELRFDSGEQRQELLSELISALRLGLRIVDQIPDLSWVGARLQNVLDDVESEISHPQPPLPDGSNFHA